MTTLLGVALAGLVPARALAESSVEQRQTDTSASAELDAAYALKAEGRREEAREAFERARSRGASAQLVELELAYLAAARGDLEAARQHYRSASRGADEALAGRARLELEAITPPPPPPAAPSPALEGGSLRTTPASALDEAYRAKASGNLLGAAAAFGRAKLAGASPQLVAMELGYLALATGDPDDARALFTEASQGPDADMGERARREKGTLPRHFYADLYGDAYNANRVAGQDNTGNAVVPMLRARGFYRPMLSVPVELYVSAQVIRDTASHGFSGTALPQIYADNYATFGGGARVKLWKRVEIFGQVGPAINLLSDGRDRTAFDGRAGALAFIETAQCAPPAESRVRAKVWPCLELYGEGVYVSRFANNVISFARPRAGLGYLMTGPVLWQVMAEGRAAKDANDDFWNNFADGGLGQRWRLLSPFRLDLLVSANAGSYFGLAGRDPAPSRLGYVDARALATTYVEF